MSDQTPPDVEPKPPNILGKFASIITLISVALYFTGWIYRWSYFGYYQIQVTTLDLPIESFFLVPIQVFLGDWVAWLRSFLVLVLTLIASLIALSLGKKIVKVFIIVWNRIRKFLQRNRFTRWLGSDLIELEQIDYGRSLIDELIIVSVILTALFYLAQQQGYLDARRDAIHTSSTLPVITLIVPENQLGLGRKLRSLDDPDDTKFRAFGDKELYQEWLGKEWNKVDPKKPDQSKVDPEKPDQSKVDPKKPDQSEVDPEKPDQSLVWRLLLEGNQQFYIFPTIPANSSQKTRPPVFVIQRSGEGNQMMILRSN